MTPLGIQHLEMAPNGITNLNYSLMGCVVSETAPNGCFNIYLNANRGRGVRNICFVLGVGQRG